ncbi:MAG: tetratricopeptide repeat protein [Planctomycetaceae bacterium]
MNLRRLFTAAMFTSVLFSVGAGSSCRPATAFVQDQNSRDAKLTERYLSLLKKNPRKGTAFDKVYAFYSEQRTLDDFVTSLADAVVADAADGSNAMILGLVEARRGNHAEASAAFAVAEKARPEDPVACWLHAESLLQSGATQDAIRALKRAVERKPQRADSLEVHQLLATTLQQSGDLRAALDVWQRLEADFPGDDRILERVGSILAENGQHEAALQRFQKLARAAKDRSKRAEFAVRAAEQLLDLDRTHEAVQAFDRLLEDVNPESWLFSDVRGRIEVALLKSGDYADVAQYYLRQLEKRPDDLDAMIRLGRFLSLNGQTTESREWFERAIRLAPSSVELREALIQELVRQDDFAAAIAQYQQLEKLSPGNPDHIEAHGHLLLRDPSQDEPARRTNAANIWKKLLWSDPADVAAVRRLAELFRSAAMTDEAIEMFEQAVTLSPDDPQNREALGEYLHTLNRHQEAIAAWNSISSGDRRNAASLVRTAEVFRNFGDMQNALRCMSEASEMDLEFFDRLQFGKWLRESGYWSDSLQQFDFAETQAVSPEDRRQLLQERLRTLQESGGLVMQAAILESQLRAEPQSSADSWLTLASYHEAAGNLTSAVRAVEQALSRDATLPAAWQLASRLLENTGRLADAVTANRRLAETDRRYHSEALRKIADLERRLGHPDASRKAAQELIDASPQNVENLQFVAELFAQLGDPVAALEALRNAERGNPTDVDAQLRLARALADQFQTDDAVAVLWNTLPRTTSSDRRTEIVRLMSELYLRADNFDQFITRLERFERESDDAPHIGLLTSVAYESAGDLLAAERVLKQGLARDARDADVLERLATIADRRGDFSTAADYQRRIVDVAPSVEAKQRLAKLLQNAGEIGEVEAAVLGLPDGSQNSQQALLTVADTFINAENLHAAGSLCEQQSNDNWRWQLRLAIVNWKQGDRESAAQHFDKIIAAGPEAVESPGASRDSSQPEILQSGRAAIEAIVGILRLRQTQAPPTSRMRDLGADDFEAARIASIAARAVVAQRRDGDSFLETLAARAQQSIDTNARPAWDWYFALYGLHAAGLGSLGETHPAIELLRQRTEPEAQLLYLTQIRSQAFFEEQSPAGQTSRATPPEPLNSEQATHLFAAWNVVHDSHPDWITHDDMIAVIRELDLAGRTRDADAVYDTLTGFGASAADMETALIVSARRNDSAAVVQQLTKLASRNWTEGVLGVHGVGHLPIERQQIPSDQVSESVARLIAWQVAHEQSDSALKVLSRFLTCVDSYGGFTSGTTAFPAQAGAGSVTVYSADGSSFTRQTKPLIAETGFSPSVVNALASAHVAFERAGRTEDLIGFFEQLTIDGDDTQHSDRAQIANHIVLELALAQLAAFNNDPQLTAVHFVRAAEYVPNNAAIRFWLVRFLFAEGNHADALALLETLGGEDGDVIRERELLALEIAQTVGLTDRARRAAEILAGMQLDGPSSQKLIRQMKTLGLDDLATDIAIRSGQPAERHISTIHRQMQQYAVQEQPRLAEQAARQILRDTAPGASPRSESGQARGAAIRLLLDAGQLTPLIESLRRQVAQTPDDAEQLEALSEFCLAAGMTAEADAITKRLTGLQPTSPAELIQRAERLQQQGQTDHACDTFLKVIRQDAAFFARDYYRLIRTFDNSNRLDELADALAGSDLSQLAANPHAVQELVEQLMRSRSHRDAGLRLFEKAWESLPAIRQNLLSNVTDERIWELPVMLDYIRRGVIPSSQQDAYARPWEGIAGPMTYRDDGCVTGTLHRLLAALGTVERRKQFLSEVDETLNRLPQWYGGYLISAVMHAQQNDVATAQTRLAALRDMQSPLAQVPGDAAWVIACALEGHDVELAAEVKQLLQIALDDSALAGRRVSAFANSPALRLARLLERDNEPSKARALILQQVLDAEYPKGRAPGFAEFHFVSDRLAAARVLTRLRYPLDSVQLLKSITSETLAASTRWNGGGGNRDRDLQEATRLAESATTVTNLRRNVQELVEQPDGSSDRCRFRFFVAAASDSVEEMKLVSVVENAIAAAASAPPDEVAALKEGLLALSQKAGDGRPSASVALFLLGTATDDGSLQSEAGDLLTSYVDGTVPVRETADGDISLWLAARSLLRKDSSTARGRRLADRAEAAARLVNRSDLLTAILKERGDLELAAGDKSAANASWNRLLDAIVSRDDSPATGPTSTAVEELRQRLLRSKP